MWGTIPYAQRSQENAERQARSVFVGNISYTATEEDLKDVSWSAFFQVSAFFLLTEETCPADIRQNRADSEPEVRDGPRDGQAEGLRVRRVQRRGARRERHAQPQ